VNISIPGIDAEFAVITLDTHDIATGTKSACGTNDSQGSHVVRTITGNAARATSTIRFTLGESNTKRDIERTITILQNHVATMHAFAGSLNTGEN
jgi:cysteine desulfurase